MKTVIFQSIAPIAGTIISVLTSWALIEFRKFIATKTKNEQINSAMTRITNTVETTVDEIAQTIVSDMRAKSQDGKLDTPQMLDVKTFAYNTVIDQIPLSVRLDAMKAVESVPKLISAKIEQAVLRLKK